MNEEEFDIEEGLEIEEVSFSDYAEIVLQDYEIPEEIKVEEEEE